MDLYSSIIPIFYVSRLFGLAPFKLSGEIGARKFHLSKVVVVYSCLVFGILLTSYVITASNQREDPDHKGTQFISIVNDVQIGVDSMLAVFFILMHVINGVKIIEFLNKLDEIDSSFKRISLGVSHRNNVQFAAIELVVASIPFLGHYLLTVLLHYVDFRTNSAYLYLIFWISFRIPKLIIQLCNLHFVNSVLSLRQRFKIVNNELMEFVDPYNIINSIAFRNKVQVVKSIGSLSLSTVKHLKYLHNALCDLTRDVNYIYSIMSLMSMANTFINLTNGLNNCFQDFITIANGKGEENLVPKIVIGFFNISMVAINAVLLTTACALTSDEANYTAVLVHKLLLKTKDPNVSEDKVDVLGNCIRTTSLFLRLQVFSMQLLHHKVKFSACGFFPLDSTLLYSIVGGVTTYLVILIQFQLAPQPGSQGNSTMNLTVATNITQ